MVPTQSQWDGVIDNNIQNTVGTWSSIATNSSAARFFGSDQMLPAASYRRSGSGELHSRGYDGDYWSSSEGSSDYAWGLYLGSSYAGTNIHYRRNGHSVRYVSE
jgi:hypothetical protein